VNRDKKTVVAVIECDVGTPLYIFDRMFDKFENKNGNKNLLDVHFDNFNIKNVFVNERYVGVAKCHEHDTFDEEFGKKLALARAKAKKADAMHTKFFAGATSRQRRPARRRVSRTSRSLERRWTRCST
jgi:hypothetical protein